MHPSPSDTSVMTMAGLNLIQQALSIYDSDLRLSVCNRRFQEMFDFPDWLVTPGASFEDTIRFQVTRGEYGPVDDIEEAIRARVDVARAFRSHYMERTRSNGQTISVEGSPLPQGGWVTVYTDITRTKQQEALLRARSEELSDQLLTYSEELSAANRQLQATITALEEAQRQLTESEARMRLTTEMMPAHIAHVGPDRRYTYSNRRLGAVIPGLRSGIVGADDGRGAGPRGIRPHPRPAGGCLCRHRIGVRIYARAKLAPHSRGLYPRWRAGRCLCPVDGCHRRGPDPRGPATDPPARDRRAADQRHGA